MDFDAEIKRLEAGIQQMQIQYAQMGILLAEANGALKQTMALKTQHEAECKDCGLKPKEK